MDSVTIGALVASTINVLIPFLTKAGEKFSEGLGSDVGGKISELIEKKFDKNKDTKKIINDIQNEPENVEFQKELRKLIEKSILEDQVFKNELVQLLKTTPIKSGDQISVNVSVSGKGKVGDISGKIVKKGE